ncbi:unnamed protein product [Rhizophagus irregularis]|nr:unnamed protein product [Rhizophagus irregularis]
MGKYMYATKMLDGGSDHRFTFGSVQIALICLFLTGDFDMLIAVRTAPNHKLEQCIKKFKNRFNILWIDSTTKQQLCKHKSLVKFIETHCQERVYTFQCNQPTCEVCYPVRMPIDIFQNLYSCPIQYHYKIIQITMNNLQIYMENLQQNNSALL